LNKNWFRVKIRKSIKSR